MLRRLIHAGRHGRWANSTPLPCGLLVISDIACAEVSAGYARVEDIGAVLAVSGIEVHAILRAGLFLAGKVFRAYRARGGAHTGVLPDFLIGAHATVAGLPPLTRDVARCCTYFPAITLIVP